jgi:transposase-like protein
MKNNNLINAHNPIQSIVTDTLTTFIKEQAQKMLRAAIETEVNDFISQHSSLLTYDGNQRIVRNGYLPERHVQTGVGDIKVKVPRIRDREAKTNPISFASNLVPKYMRRSATLDVLLPLLYLKGVSTGDFQSSLAPILGSNANNLSANTITRLKNGWHDDYLSWQKRSLADKHYVYWWVDGIYLKARMEDDKTCMLVIIGADETGRKELVGLLDGYRESKDSWRELLLKLQERGLKKFPVLAVGDGALGFWGALNELSPNTKHQRCWVHKTANILDKMPKSQHEQAKKLIHDIYLAATKKDALQAWDGFIKRYDAKYPKAVECLLKDKESLLTFYDFPAEHWVHLRTTNPIESTFATVRHRTKKSKNCHSRTTIIACVFKLILEAEKRWKCLCGKKRIAQVINLEQFIDGIHKDEIIYDENNNNLDNKKAA